LCGHAVHAIGGRADEDFFAARDAKGANEGVDGFIGADADKEVVWSEGLGGVGVRIAECAKLLFEVDLVAVMLSVQLQLGQVKSFVRVWVAVQSEEINVNGRC
jgi:hypothetical protein